MLRNRDSFFQSSHEMAMNMQTPNMGYGFYPNNNMNFNYPNGNYGVPNNTNINNNYNFEDYDNRIAKLERQINRLDARLTKLESNSKIINDDLSSSMYMV